MYVTVVLPWPGFFYSEGRDGMKGETALLFHIVRAVKAGMDWIKVSEKKGYNIYYI